MLCDAVNLECAAQSENNFSPIVGSAAPGPGFVVWSVGAGSRLTFLTTPPSQAVISHTVWDAYLSQEQLTQREITLSPTYKGHVVHLLTELPPSFPAFHCPRLSAPGYTALHAVCHCPLSIHWSWDNFKHTVCFNALLIYSCVTSKLNFI